MSQGKVLIVYFSGTGGAKRVADCFEKGFIKRNFTLVKHSLDINEYSLYKDKYNELLTGIDYLFIIYSVHALDAPEPVYSWINDLPHSTGIKTAVISISGGGDIWPNTSCRAYCIKASKKKGLNVVYEDMMVMPSNWMIATGDHACMWLLKSMPLKTERIIDDVIAGKEQHSSFKLSTRILFAVPKLEKKFTKKYGQSLATSDKCCGCGWCSNNCPRNNIKMEGNIPVFSNNCIVCLRCIYGCPQGAIFSKRHSWVAIKDGFSLAGIEERMKGLELLPIEQCCKGILFAGIKKYLLEIYKK